MHATEWAAVGSAAFAAIAAGASWWSVWQNRRERLAAQRPELIIEMSVHLPSNKVLAQIHNNGGTARSVRFCVIEGSFMAYGTPQPTGIFQSGESRTIETDLPPTKDRAAKAWVSGIDPEARYVYATTSKGSRSAIGSDGRTAKCPTLGLLRTSTASPSTSSRRSRTRRPTASHRSRPCRGACFLQPQV